MQAKRMKVFLSGFEGTITIITRPHIPYLLEEGQDEI